MQTVVSAIMGTTPTGRPRSSGRDLLLHRGEIGIQIDEKPVEECFLAGTTGWGGLVFLRWVMGGEAKVRKLLRPLFGRLREARIGRRRHFRLKLFSPFLCHFATKFSFAKGLWITRKH